MTWTDGLLEIVLPVDEDGACVCGRGTKLVGRHATSTNSHHVTSHTPPENWSEKRSFLVL